MPLTGRTKRAAHASRSPTNSLAGQPVLRDWPAGGTLSFVSDSAQGKSLRNYLAACSPLDAHQERALRQMEQLLLQSDGDPFHRSHLEPGHFTASGLVLDRATGSLLLIFHRKLQRWLQPGGHFELGDDDHVAAARRELAEEVLAYELDVLDPLYDLDVHTIPANAREGEHLHFDLRVLFLCRQAEVHATDEVESARYFPLRDLAAGSSPGADSDGSVARVARRLLTRAR
jgi:8-oxo-dGTP pyrophosphatase MutT (NUDIX family)